MTSIIVYQPELQEGDNADTTATKRRAGMLRAGKALRNQLEFTQTDTEVEFAVNKVVQRLVRKPSQNVFVETGDPGAPVRYMVGKRNRKGKFKLEKSDDPTDDKRKLRLKGVIDDYEDENGEQEKRNFRMTVVSPFDSNNSSWEYLAKTVYADLKEIEGTGDPEDIENYLIATFAFTRCR